jgi:hypothetical protein
MFRKALLTGIAAGVLTIASVGVFAAENPLNPSYQTPQQKHYVMEFCKMDANSDGTLTVEEYLNKGNPLSPGFDKNPKYTKKLEQWKAMAGDKKEMTMEMFVAYMDTHNPLNPNFIKK